MLPVFFMSKILSNPWDYNIELLITCQIPILTTYSFDSRFCNRVQFIFQTLTNC